MSSLDAVAGQVGVISNETTAINNALGRLTGGSFWQQLKPASFRGVPFKCLAAGARFGRRNAVHEYVNRDTPWVEDLGRQARRFQVQGFVVGDDVIAQRDQLIAACERTGDGELVHPTYGRRVVALLDFAAEERSDHGRVFEFTFTFIEQGQRLYPSSSTNGQGAIASSAAAASTSSIASWIQRGQAVLAKLQSGVQVVQAAAATASEWANNVVSVSRDATSIVKLAIDLPGQFGRLLGLASGVDPGEIVAAIPGLTLQQLSGQATANRVAAQRLAAALTASTTNLNANGLQRAGNQAAAIAAQIRGESSTPGDALRNLAVLATYVPIDSSLTGDALTMQTAIADMLRRAALVEMCNAAAAYQPASADDAAFARDELIAVLDPAITTAGDQFEDDFLAQLQSLRTLAVIDLDTRGAKLPTLVTVTTGASLPSGVLAQMLYRDATRSDELVRRAVPIHPAFMPLTFQALNQ